jgi:hypothetical protein
MSFLNWHKHTPPPPQANSPSPPGSVGGTIFSTISSPRSLDQQREDARGDLARGLIWLLTLAIGGVLVFVGLGRLDGTVITQSIFPSLVALAGTALGFYFGSSTKGLDSGTGTNGANTGGSSQTVSRTPPVANAGPDQTVTVGATVALKGSGAAGASGAQIAYAWTLTSLPANSTAALTGANTASPTFVADQPGSYVAQLIVNDGLASTPSTTNVTAAPASVLGGPASGAVSRTPPIANAGSNQIVTTGDTVTLDAGASKSASGMQLNYEWTLTTIPAGSKATLTGANTASPTFVADQQGTYAAQLIVNDGLASPPSTTNVTAS